LFGAPTRVDRAPADATETFVSGASLACEGDTVMVAYFDAADEVIRANVSADGGVTWLTPDRLVAPAGGDNVTSIHAGCGGGRLQVAWSVADSIGVATSGDAGVTWTVRQITGTSLAFDCDGPNVVIAWSGDYPPGHIYTDYSPNGGASWVGAVSVSGPLPCSAYLGEHAVACAGAASHLTYVTAPTICGQGWRDYRVHVVRLHSGIVSDVAYVDTTGAPADQFEAVGATVHADGLHVHVTWLLQDILTTRTEMRSVHSDNGGTSWSPADYIIADDWGGRLLPLLVDGPYGHLGVKSGGFSGLGSAQVYTGSGGTWTASAPLERSAGGTAVKGPALARGDGNLYAVFGDDEAAVRTIRFLWSADHGATWSPDATVVGSGAYGVLKICADGQRVYVLWADSAGDLQFNASHP
jgi:hypothetical protein